MNHTKNCSAEPSQESRQIIARHATAWLWRYPTLGDGLQAAWVHFAETGSHPLLCMLQPTLLTIYSLGGELHSVPLACKFTQIWPLPRGLILAVSQASWEVRFCMRTSAHPLLEVQLVRLVQYTHHADIFAVSTANDLGEPCRGLRKCHHVW